MDFALYFYFCAYIFFYKFIQVFIPTFSVSEIWCNSIGRFIMSPRKVFTLALIREGGKVLLGMKKRGFGKGKWNGFGGKVEAGETIHEAAVRELKEESGLVVKKFKYVGVLDFEFAEDPTILEVHVFTTDTFSGEPTASDEMEPRWFLEKDIPFNQMWPDDEIWFPLFLKGATFKGYFYYKDQDTIDRYSLTSMDDTVPEKNESVTKPTVQ